MNDDQSEGRIEFNGLEYRLCFKREKTFQWPWGPMQYEWYVASGRYPSKEAAQIALDHELKRTAWKPV